MTEPILKLEPSGYRVNPEKLKGASQSILPYLFSCFYFKEEFEYFDVIKPYLDIPEPRKSLEELSQELEEKFDILIEKTKEDFYFSKQIAERHYESAFDRIIGNFEYAQKNGEFPPKLTIGGTFDYSTLSVNSGSFEQSLVIKQGKKHEGYYTFGNRRYFKYYIPDKPNFVVRFFMDKLLGFKWVDEKDT